MNEARLRHLFRDTIALLSASTLGCPAPSTSDGAASGAAATPPNPSAPTSSAAVAPPSVSASTPEAKAWPPSLKLAPCEHDQPVMVHGIRPAKPVDYVELRQVTVGKGPNVTTTLRRAGELCASAASKSACTKEFATLKSRDGFQLGCVPGGCVHQLAYNDANSSHLAVNAQSVRTLLGDIDTRGDALLWAWVAGYYVTSCSKLDKNLVRTDAGYEFNAIKRLSDCPVTTHAKRIRVATDGSISMVADHGITKSEVCAGRRPLGLATTAAEGDGVGRYLADMAHLEAASVVAFERIAEDLVRLGAPAALSRRAREAAQDEREHTAIMARLARVHGVEPPPVRCADQHPATAYQMALDNEVEGCVRETFGALVGWHQAQHARDPGVRAAMQIIARDETRHAALSWDLAQWLRTRLSAVERRALDAARHRAVEALRQPVVEPPFVRAALGLPDAAAHAAAVQALVAQLWSVPTAA